MDISRRVLSQVLHAINPGWALHDVQKLGGRASALDCCTGAGSHARLILLTHSERDRERNPQIARDEFRLLESLRCAGLPVAKALQLEAAHDPPFLVTTYLPGTPKFSAADLPNLPIKLADTLSAIHHADVALGELSFLPNQADMIRDCLQASVETKDQITPVMRRALPRICMNSPTLLHGDFWLGNLLWQGDRLAGIIDWEDAMLGDPLGDLGKSRLEMLWALGSVAMEQYTNRYLAQNPKLDGSALAFWDLWGALRLAHFASFASDVIALDRMQAQYDEFIGSALRYLDSY